jgi:hypothetical protein
MVAFGLVVLGALLIWQLAKPRNKANQQPFTSEIDNSDLAVRRLVHDLAEPKEKLDGADRPGSAFCVECGNRMEAAWKYCPLCGSAKLQR